MYIYIYRFMQHLLQNSVFVSLTESWTEIFNAEVLFREDCTAGEASDTHTHPRTHTHTKTTELFLTHPKIRTR